MSQIVLSGGGSGGASAATPQYPKWITDILTGVGAPINQTTVSNLWAWNQCEGSDAHYNAFNTTLPQTGSTPINSANVQSYTSYAQGLLATLTTLRYPRYAQVVAALRSGADRSTFASAVGSSGWGTSGSCIASAAGLNGPTNANSGAAASAGTSGSSGSGSGSGSSSATGCGSKGNLWSLDLGITSVGINHCQGKALLGGVCMAGGALLLLAGVLVIARGPIMRVAGTVASATGPAGAAAETTAKAVAPKAAAPAPAAKPAPAPSAPSNVTPITRAKKPKAAPDEDDQWAASHRTARRDNRSGYQRSMGAQRDRSDTRKRTA